MEHHVDKPGRSTFEPSFESADAARQARDLLRRHPHFGGRADDFEFELCDSILVVRGCVPTFYLKQLLQHALQQLDGVAEIDNCVTVARPELPESIDG
jgi:hypothetical protein